MFTHSVQVRQSSPSMSSSPPPFQPTSLYYCGSPQHVQWLEMSRPGMGRPGMHCDGIRPRMGRDETKYVDVLRATPGDPAGQTPGTSGPRPSCAAYLIYPPQELGGSGFLFPSPEAATDRSAQKQVSQERGPRWSHLPAWRPRSAQRSNAVEDRVAQGGACHFVVRPPTKATSAAMARRNREKYRGRIVWRCWLRL
jgi:hypothetical protein